MILCSFATSVVFAQTCPDIKTWQHTELHDDEYLIVLLRANREIITDNLEIFASEDKNLLLVPVSALNSLLKLNWNVAVDDKRLESHDSTDSVFQFPCDFNYQLMVQNEDSGIKWGTDEFDLYVDMRTLAELLDATYSLDYAGAILNLTTSLVLPGIKNSGFGEIPSFFAPEVIAPDRIIQDQYSLFTYPQINYRATALYDNQNDALNGQLQLNSSFDLLNHDVQLRLNQSQDFGNQFIRFGKSIPLNDPRTPDKSLRYEFGDILLQSDELVVSSKQAAGIQILTNNPNFSRRFSTITIEEITLPDWRGQLFRNGQFIDEVFTNDDNRVVFTEVETFFGTNQYEIKLYGPEGQQEVRTQTITIGQNLQPGTVDFSASYVDLSANTIDANDEEQPFDQQFIARVSYGINQSLSTELSAYSLSGLDEEQQFVASSINGTFNTFSLRAQVATDIDGGEAYFLGINTDLGRGIKLNAQSRVLNNFSSEELRANRNLKTDTDLSINGSTQVFRKRKVNWSARFSHSAFEEQRDQNRLTFVGNSRIFGGNFSTTLIANDLSDINDLTQRINWSKSFNGWNISNDLGLNPLNGQRVNFYNATLRWPRSVEISNETRISFDNDSESPIQIEHLLNWRRPEFNLRFGTFVNEDGDWGVNFGITGDIEYDPIARQPRFYRTRGSNVSTIQAFAFLDENRNAIFDENDSPLSDVQLLGDVQWRNLKTNQDGRLQVSTRRFEQDVQIDEASLPDIYLEPAEQLVRLKTHPGGNTSVELPIVTFNEIEGAIYISKGKQSRGFAGLSINLVNSRDEVVASTVTEVDGFFFMTGIEPGEYQLQLAPSKLAQQNLTILNSPEVINAPLEGDSIRINDLVLVNKDQNIVPSTAEPNLALNLDEPEPIRVSTLAQVVLNKNPNSKFQLNPSAAYYVQLGVFKHPSSIVEVIKFLPTEQFDLKIYRHHLKALSYVVLGPYQTADVALEQSNKIRQYDAFSGAFIRPIRRFESKDWALEYELKELSEHLHSSHETIRQANPNSYFCQLASYRALTSIPQQHLNSLASKLITKRQVNQQRFYTLYTGPYTTSDACQNQAKTDLSINNVFAVPTKNLVTTLLPIQ